MPHIREIRFIVMLTPEDRYRHYHMRYRGNVISFVVQYETLLRGKWQPVIRYDTAHGEPHTDVIRPDGTKDKRLLHFPNFNDAFSYAEEDIKANWEQYRQRYFRR